MSVGYMPKYELGAAGAGVGERGSGFLDVVGVLCCGGTGGSFIWVVDVGYVTAYL